MLLLKRPQESSSRTIMNHPFLQQIEWMEHKVQRNIFWSNHVRMETHGLYFTWFSNAKIQSSLSRFVRFHFSRIWVEQQSHPWKGAFPQTWWSIRMEVRWPILLPCRMASLSQWDAGARDNGMVSKAPAHCKNQRFSRIKGSTHLYTCVISYVYKRSKPDIMNCIMIWYNVTLIYTYTCVYAFADKHKYEADGALFKPQNRFP